MIINLENEVLENHPALQQLSVSKPRNL